MNSNLHDKTKSKLLDFIQFSQIEFEKKLEEKATQLEEKTTQLEQKSAQIAALNERIQLLTLARFGTRSEKFAHPHQLSLFDEANLTAEALPLIESAEAEIQVASFTRKKKGGRRALPAHLPRVEILHALPDDQKQCACGCLLVKIGDERS